MDPDLAARSVLVHADIADVVVEQPAAPVEILPAVPAEFGGRIEARRCEPGAEFRLELPAATQEVVHG